MLAILVLGLGFGLLDQWKPALNVKTAQTIDRWRGNPLWYRPAVRSFRMVGIEHNTLVIALITLDHRIGRTQYSQTGLSHSATAGPDANMATEPAPQAILPPPRGVKRSPTFSHRMVAFTVGWLLGWPLLVFAYNPLAAPYDPLTLLIVVPGGATWLFLFLYICCNVYETVFTMAEARWPAAKSIREALSVLPKLLMYMLWCVP